MKQRSIAPTFSTNFPVLPPSLLTETTTFTYRKLRTIIQRHSHASLSPPNSYRKGDRKMEAFPVQFCRAVRSYWHRRRYQRLETGKRRKVKVAKLGGGYNASAAGGGVRRPIRLRRICGIRSTLLSPVRLLARLRDAYVDSMLGLAGKGSGLSGAVGSDALINRRIPRAHPAKLEAGDFERRLILEICRSVRASGEIAVY